MKRLGSQTKRTGDNLKVMATFRDRMRRQGHVRVVCESVEPGALVDTTVIEGDAADVSDTLAALAEIAWENGWRPRGLDVVLGHMVKVFKLPKPE
jgi:hypothetical protein